MMKMKLTILLAFFFIVGALARPEPDSKEKSGERGSSAESGAGSQEGSSEDSGTSTNTGSNGQSNESGDVSKRSATSSGESSSCENEESNCGSEMENNSNGKDNDNNGLTGTIDKAVGMPKNSSVLHYLRKLNPLRLVMKVPILGTIMRWLMSIASAQIKFIENAFKKVGQIFSDALKVIPGV